MIDQYLNIFDTVYDASENNLDKVLQELKTAGASQMQSVMVLLQKLKLTIPEADAIVINSIAWIAHKESIENFRDDFWDQFDELDETEL